MTRTTIKELLRKKEIGFTVCVKGWVRTKRDSKKVIFIMVNDGSTIHNLQVVMDAREIKEEICSQITAGASLSIEGVIISSPGFEQAVELQASKIEVLGTAVNYPLQPKRHSLDFLREIAHLRFRTNTFGAIFRIRHAASYAIHHFFHTAGFTYLHTPIITAIDAEGAGNMFGVSTLDFSKIPKKEDGDIDFKTDFFGKKTSLTVSGQLEAEAAALGLGAVYTFGPTFRAENSNTSRHLAEFWMVEPEVAFNNLYDNIALAESFLKYVIQFVLEHCPDDLDFLQKRAKEAQAQKTDKIHTIPLLMDKLTHVIENTFICITYTEAIDILKSSKPNRDKTFAYPIQEWGSDLQSEHERYLVEEYFKRPVIITHYPSAIKAFYMRQEANNTVAAMDVLFPGIGEIIGGSQREERLDKLIETMNQKGMKVDTLNWYLETRLFGTIEHSGFGLGFERLLLFITGMENIRDVIAFPRTPGHADF